MKEKVRYISHLLPGKKIWVRKVNEKEISLRHIQMFFMCIYTHRHTYVHIYIRREIDIYT